MKRKFEYKKNLDKSYFEIKGKNIFVQDGFGGRDVKFADYTDCVCVAATDQIIPFIITLEKMQEDWDVTEELFRYTMETMLKIMTDVDTIKYDPEWLEDHKKFVREHLEKLG